jgi:protein-glutamine gamma-glutamyltransferase
VLRIKARPGAYWKTVNLGDFDGVRWVTDTNVRGATDTEFARRRGDWFQTIRVVDRGLRSRLFVGAGHTLRILPSGPAAVSLAPGTFQTVRGALVPGSAYQAIVYVPRPSEGLLRSAGTDYPAFVTDELSVDVPDANPGIAPATLRFPAFGSANTEPDVLLANGFQPQGGRQVLEGSALARVYDLAQSLRADSATPFELVERVRDRVQLDATYTESPRPSRNPLVDFLFNTHEGYCQQFSGAMALLLRMGGVPARVASGFSPGRFDRRRGEYIVRDDDAHSWVEAYFPGIGWYTLDPTPAASPARSQLNDQGPVSNAAARQGAPSLGGSGDRPFAPGDPGAAAADEGGMSRALVIALGVLAVALLGGATLAVRRGRLPGEPIAPELAELQRALHRSGRTPAPQTTLTQLESVLGGSDAARGYLRAISAQRFGPGGHGPTPAQRRALRRELASGLGLRGRLRAWWALPPVRVRRRDAPYTG